MTSPGWIQEYAGVEKTQPDTSMYFDAYMYGSLEPSPPPLTFDGHAEGLSSSNATVLNANHDIIHGAPFNAGNQSSSAHTISIAVRLFVEEDVVTGNNEPVMSIVEMCLIVLGRLYR